MSNFEKLIKQGIAAQQAQKWSDAEQCYRGALRQKPRDTDANLLLGTLLLQLGKPAEAEQLLATAADLQKNNVVAWINLGSARDALGKTEEAIVAYRRALDVNASHPSALLNLAAIYADAKRYDDAIPLYRRLLRAEPNNRGALIDLSRVLMVRGEVDEAKELLESALRADSSWDAGQLQLGHIYQASGGWGNAVKHYATVVTRDPSNADAMFFLGAGLLEIGDTDSAVTCLKQALQLKPVFPACHERLANVQAQLGNDDAADEHYRLAVQQNPQFVEAWNNYADFLIRSKRYADAEAAAKRALEISPAMLAARCNFAAAVYKQGRFDLARAEYRRCLEQDSAYGPAALGWVNCLMRTGNFEPFLGGIDEVIQIALRAAPDDPNVHWTYALLLLVRGKLREAWREYDSGLLVGQRPKCEYPFPIWKGESLSDKAILVYGEQGVGDQIMFASMYRDLVACSGRVIMHTDARMVPLFQRSFPSAIVEPFPDDPARYKSTTHVDCFIAAGSLGQFFRNEVDDSPARQSFLKAGADRVVYWRNRLARRDAILNVGIAWRSGVRNVERNLSYWSIEETIELLQTAGVQFVNVQYGDCAEELTTVRHAGVDTLVVFPEVDLKNDFVETAALLSALDIVIAPAIATCMLSAAVGTETWLVGTGGILEFGTANMPWFPTATVFHKDTKTWPEILRLVRLTLEARVRDRMHQMDGI